MNAIARLFILGILSLFALYIAPAHPAHAATIDVPTCDTHGLIAPIDTANSTFNQYTATSDGGAVFNRGMMSILNVTLTDNTAEGEGGNIMSKSSGTTKSPAAAPSTKVLRKTATVFL